MKKIIRLNKRVMCFFITLMMFTTLMGTVVFAYVPSEEGSTTYKMHVLTYQKNEYSIKTTTITDIYISDLETGIKYADDVAQSINTSNYMYGLGVFFSLIKCNPPTAVVSFLAGAVTQLDLNARDALSKKIKAAIYASPTKSVHIRYSNIKTTGYGAIEVADVSGWDGSSFQKAYTLDTNLSMPLTNYTHSN